MVELAGCRVQAICIKCLNHLPYHKNAHPKPTPVTTKTSKGLLAEALLNTGAMLV